MSSRATSCQLETSCNRRLEEFNGGESDESVKLGELEARVGIEPTHKGFADLSLTTWVPRLVWAITFQPC